MPYDCAAFATDELAVLMTLAQEGAFHRLLRHAWINGSIPCERNAIALLVRENFDAFALLWTFPLDKMWVTSSEFPDRLINLKQEKERQYCENKMRSAQASASERWA